MNTRQKKFPISERLRQPLDDIGGEPVEGSGFEAEVPELDFSDDTLPVEAPRS